MMVFGLKKTPGCHFTCSAWLMKSYLTTDIPAQFRTEICLPRGGSGDVINVSKYLQRRCEENGVRCFFSGALWQGKRQWAQTEHQETLLHEDDLAHIPWIDGRVSILGDLQKPSLGDLTWAEEFEQMLSRDPSQLQPFMVTHFKFKPSSSS